LKLILASGSPRRKEILESAGLSFEVAPSEFDESSLKSEFPDKLVEGLALGKGLAKQALLSPTDKSENIVLAADTLVYLPEEGSTADAPKGTFLGKPHTEKISREMLNCLSGRYHEVWSAYALLLGEKQVCRSVCTKISFRKLSENEIENYVLTKESLDKAGLSLRLT